jgi:elongation factor G
VPLNLRPLPRDYLALGVVVEPTSAGDRQKLAQLLHGGKALGPAHVSDDPESGLVVLGAASEAQLDGAIETLRAAGIAMNVGAPQVAYREILSAPVEADHTHKRVVGPKGDFARVRMRFEPNARSMSNTFSVAESSPIPAEYLPAIEKGFRAVIGGGSLTGFPIVACHATLVDGTHHDVDSSPLAFEIAARAVFREAVPAEAVILLEPYLEVDITTPQALVGAVVSDFKSRRGVNTLKEASPGVAAIYGFAPLANMLGYEASLVSLTRGRATYSWKLAGLEEVPAANRPDNFSPAAAKRG